MILSLVALLALLPQAQDTTYTPQGVKYRIEATLDEDTDVLRGRARLRYANRAPAALDTIYLHQHLNAFRPESAWARRDLRFGQRRFQDLGPEEHAFERFRSVQVNGVAVEPVYPLAPDSTVVAIPLPSSLRPGESVVLLMDWDARLSTLPRRQGRKGRHFDFAQWYPRIAVYERGAWQAHPLLPQGEFYGEFGSYDVTFDLAADQVIGSTGVPVEGDPGWTPSADERAAYAPRAAEPLGLLDASTAAGRKRVRFLAEDVHHFAWSIDPEYRHDSVERFSLDDAGEKVDLPDIHVLYLPGDTAWADQKAARKTYEAVRWTQSLFGPYPWPQLTNVHRLEPGGTEFPMLIMNGSASEGLIVHEVVHQYLHGILANNEWREGWLDEGFTSFVTNWYFEDKGQTGVWDRSLEGLAKFEREHLTQPVSTPSAEFRNERMYGVMTYTKASVVFYMLREMVGEETMRKILRTYYDRHKLQRVTGEDFQRVAEEVTGQDLDWFFRQWLDTTATLDYGVGAASTTRTGDGRWRTRVEVIRTGEAWMPVTVQVDGEQRQLTGRDRVQVVEIVTRGKPDEVVLDPASALHDIDPTNDRRPVS